MYPISEIFGPTIQGEGAMAGKRTFFLRFAGCDWDCMWCDTKYAVNPQYPGWKKEMMSAPQIAQRLAQLGAVGGDWITLSGGNPALFYDTRLGEQLELSGWNIAMETQGSRAMEMEIAARIHLLTISPKPPSSGMHGRLNVQVLTRLINAQRIVNEKVCLKFVFFTEDDLNWIHEISSQIAPVVPRYLSVGTPLQSSDEVDVRLQVCESTREAFELVSRDARFKDFIVLPQLHTLAWGRKTGV